MALITHFEPDLPPCCACGKSVYINSVTATVRIDLQPIKVCQHTVYHQDCVRNEAIEKGRDWKLSCKQCNIKKSIKFVPHYFGLGIVMNCVSLLLCILGTWIALYPSTTTLLTMIMMVIIVVLLMARLIIHTKLCSRNQREWHVSQTHYAFSYVVFDGISLLMGCILLILAHTQSMNSMAGIFIAALFLPILHWLQIVPYCMKRIPYSWCCTNLTVLSEDHNNEEEEEEIECKPFV